MLFLDEIHRMSRSAEEMLYLAMEDFRVDVIVGKGPGATAIPLELPPFTVVGATTRAGLLPAPLRDRFGFTGHLDFYATEDLVTILRRSARLLGVEADDDGIREIALRSRGTPRIANRLLRRVRDWAQVHGLGIVDLERRTDGAGAVRRRRPRPRPPRPGGPRSPLSALRRWPRGAHHAGRGRRRGVRDRRDRRRAVPRARGVHRRAPRGGGPRPRWPGATSGSPRLPGAPTRMPGRPRCRSATGPTPTALRRAASEADPGTRRPALWWDLRGSPRLPRARRLTCRHSCALRDVDRPDTHRLPRHSGDDLVRTNC